MSKDQILHDLWTAMKRAKGCPDAHTVYREAYLEHYKGFQTVKRFTMKQQLDEVTDLIDTINSTGQFSAAEITRCPVCQEWKIPRYDAETGKMTRKHVCHGPNAASKQ